MREIPIFRAASRNDTDCGDSIILAERRHLMQALSAGVVSVVRRVLAAGRFAPRCWALLRTGERGIPELEAESWFHKPRTANALAGLAEIVLLSLTHLGAAMAETRKLAAILAADGAGYSRLAAAVGEGGIADIEQNAGARYFKLKLVGDPDAEAARLTRIGMALAKLAYDTRVTLDANEHYSDFASLKGLVDRLRNDAALGSIASRLLYVEQPMPRDLTRAVPLCALSAFDFIIDEADDSYSAFPAARLLGYRGISSKSCKGFYKSIFNATRAAKWSEPNDKFFITGEDLSCQAGLSVQQDVALGALLGTTHTERNGHHYVDGFGETPEEEANAFLGAHPDLYAHDDGRVRLAIHDGDLLTESLVKPGFATGMHPLWQTMLPLRPPKTKIVSEQVL